MAIVAIVGRPNVGKSTLFNIFADSRISIVEDTPGVTRDRLYAEAEWLDRRFMMVDTGGIEIANTDSIAVSIREQAKIAIKEADVILFVCDARTGVTTEDQEVAKLIRMAQKPVVLAVNKADTPTQELEAYEFYNLGIGEPYMISASNRLNLGDLLDAVVSHFPDEDESDDDDHDDVIKVAIIGRPNVGKSTFINKVARRKAAAAGDRPGVTRGKQWITVDQGLLLLDTPGILWPKFEDPEVGMRLAYTGAVKEDVIDTETLACHFMELLAKFYPQTLLERYKLEAPEGADGYDLLQLAGRKRGYLISGGEVNAIGGKNALCDALVELFGEYSSDHFGWAKEIWDVSTIAYLVNPDWIPTVLEHSPLLTDDCHWAHDANRHFIRVATFARRTPIFRDLYRKLAGA